MPEKLSIGVVMDPIQAVKPSKDSTFAMLLAMTRRGHHAHYLELSDLWLRDGAVLARSRPITVRDQARDFHQLGDPVEGPVDRFDILLMRKDPPFDLEYIYATYLLELAEQAGVRVVNRARSLRDANEKAFTAHFPQCCPPTLITRDRARIRAFLAEQERIVVKPMDGMGGASVFRLDQGDPNTSVILETITHFDRRTVIAQRFLPEYRQGDKRILLIHGKPVDYALARIPAEGESRANLAAGGRGEAVPLTERDRWICAQLESELCARGLDFVGLDVIGDYLTEINVTSPTGVRELDRARGLDIAGTFIEFLESGTT
ncbi:glutathione synthase [Thioalkalivibrio paradoxus]|uniref:Glutathione synthetase n=1 Tax=Thioalkalivibrio paradoxus ARh 1 TaxID=713585 RepID=W0DM52_9GAMM|nr:glutathione synthase [Thioalkalivibrio paradoxus]AHE99536.1 glutathione synthetase [Thioalkalivibrio paradoxus ARh 1]